MFFLAPKVESYYLRCNDSTIMALHISESSPKSTFLDQEEKICTNDVCGMMGSRLPGSPSSTSLSHPASHHMMHFAQNSKHYLIWTDHLFTITRYFFFHGQCNKMN